MGRKIPGRQATQTPSIEGDAAARDDAMEVGMIGEVLAPAVQHRDETDPGAEMSGICGDGAQRLGGRLEQDRVDRRLVLEGDCGDLGGQREHHVEVGNPEARPAAR